MKKKLIWEGLGFPILLIGFPIKKIGNEKFPDVNMKDIQEKAFHSLMMKEIRLTGSELKFIRTYLQLTQQEFSKAINSRDRSSVSQWEQKKDKLTGMDLNTEIMVRLFMAKQCEEGSVKKGIQDLAWYRMKDIIFDFLNHEKTKNSEKYISISA